MKLPLTLDTGAVLARRHRCCRLDLAPCIRAEWGPGVGLLSSTVTLSLMITIWSEIVLPESKSLSSPSSRFLNKAWIAVWRLRDDYSQDVDGTNVTVTDGADDTEYLLEKSGFEQSCPTVIASIMYDKYWNIPTTNTCVAPAAGKTITYWNVSHLDTVALLVAMVNHASNTHIYKHVRVVRGIFCGSFTPGSCN